MKKNKPAFTVTELLIVMAIIGVLSVIGLNIFKSFDKGIRYIYSNSYHSLDRAFYNAVNFSSLENPFAKEDAPTETFPYATNNPNALANFDAAGKNKERIRRLCNMLTEYIDTTFNNCSAGATATPNGDSFGTPSFIAVNGVRFYITNMLPDSATTELATLPEAERNNMLNGHKFFIVFADVSGERGLNSMRYVTGDANTKAVDPDIFAFAALEIGRMCPIGPPEVDARFMQTRIMYHDKKTQTSAGIGLWIADLYNDSSKNIKMWFANTYNKAVTIVSNFYNNNVKTASKQPLCYSSAAWASTDHLPWYEYPGTVKFCEKCKQAAYNDISNHQLSWSVEQQCNIHCPTTTQEPACSDGNCKQICDEDQEYYIDKCVPKCESGLRNPKTGECIIRERPLFNCPEGQEYVFISEIWMCKPKCPEGATRDSQGDCFCPFGQEVIGGVCTDKLIEPDPDPSLACPNGKVPDGSGGCICPNNQVNDGSGGCTCEGNNVKVGSYCQECTNGYVADDEHVNCTCNNPMQIINGVCKIPEQGSEPDPNTDPDPNPDPDPDTNCPSGKIPDGSGGCKCPDDKIEVDGVCQQKTQTSATSYDEDFNDDGITVKFSTVSKPYYVSKAEAWGYYLTGQTSNGYPSSDDAIMVEDNPYMYNGYIKMVLDKLYPNNMIYGFLGKDANGKPNPLPRADANGSGIHLMSGKIRAVNKSERGYECYPSSDEECDVIIEKYLY